MVDAHSLAIEYGGKPMSPVEAAQHLPHDVKKIRQMCIDGEIDSITVRTENRVRYYIYPAAIDAWIRQHQTAA